MARILYLSGNAQGSHDHAFLHGKNFVLHLKSKHEILVRAYAVENKLTSLTSHPIGAKFTDDLTDISEIDEFDPELIISEMPLIEAGQGWKIPLLWLEQFVQKGGCVLVIGVNRYSLQKFVAINRFSSNYVRLADDDLLDEFFQFINAEPLNWRNSQATPGLPYMREQIYGDLARSLEISAQEGISYPGQDRPSRWGWDAQWNGVEQLLLSDPMPIEVNLMGGSGTTLARLNDMSILVNDLFVLDAFGLVKDASIAAVCQKGNGYVATVSAHLISDNLVERCPDNLLWATNLIDLLISESKKNVAIRSVNTETRYSILKPFDDWFTELSVGQINDIVQSEESATLEYKSSCLGSKESQVEIMDQICAFANTEGGILLVGVSDNGEIIGIDQELKKVGGRDEYRKRLTAIARNSLMPNSADNFRTYFVDIKGKTVLQIGIRDSGTQVIYRKREDGLVHECWQRTNSGKQKLDAVGIETLLERKKYGKKSLGN